MIVYQKIIKKTFRFRFDRLNIFPNLNDRVGKPNLNDRFPHTLRVGC